MFQQSRLTENLHTTLTSGLGSGVQPPQQPQLPVMYTGQGIVRQFGANPNWNPYGMTNPYIPENNPQKQVYNYQTRLQYAHQPVPEREVEGGRNFLNTALDLLSRPQSAVTNMILAGMDGGNFGDVLGAGWRGLTGEQKSSTSDIFTKMGWQPQEGDTVGKALKFTLGLAGDILLDPTTYLSLGTLGFAKGVGAGAAKALAQELPVRSVDTLTQKLSTQLGLSAEEITRQAGRHGANSQLVMELAERLSLDSADEAKRILNVGLDAVNKDTIQNYAGVMSEKLNETLGLVDAASKSRRKSFGQLFKPLNNTPYDVNQFLQKGSYDLDKFESFNRQLTDIFDFAELKPTVTVQDKKSFLDNILGGEVSEEFASRITDTEYHLMNAMVNTFGLKSSGADLMSIASDVVKNMYTKTGRPKNVENYRKMYTAEVVARRTQEGYEEGIRFANGLERVYNTATKSYHMKYMGKPLFDFSNTVGKAAKDSFDKLMESSPLVRGLVDALGHTFKAGYVAQKLRVDSPEEYEAVKQVSRTVTEYLHKTTGLPHDALQAVTAAYDVKFMQDARLREGAAIYAERGIDEHAERAWQEWVAKNNPTPEEMKMIEDAVVTNSLLNEAIFRLDQQILGADRFKEEGYDVSKYGFEGYVRRLYRNDPEEVQKILAGRTVKQQEGQALKLKASSFKSRRYDSAAGAEHYSDGKLMPVRDIVASSAVRYLDSLRISVNMALQKALITMAESDKAFAHLISRTEKKGMSKPGNLDIYVAPEIMQQLNRIVPALSNNQGAAYFLQIADKFTNMIKTLQTSANPSFVIRNAFGETLMNWFADVSLEAHDIANKVFFDITNKNVTRIGDDVFLNGKPLMRLVEGGAKIQYGIAHSQASVLAKTPDAKGWGDVVDFAAIEGKDFDSVIRDELKKQGVNTFLIGGREYTALELMNIFRDKGLGWSGITKGNLVENMEDTLKREISRRTTTARRVVGGLREVADYFETWTRLSHMIDRMMKGMSVDEAVADVRLYHVDYRDLTTVERDKFRRIAPYYTYMRKNFPIQLRLLLTQPGKMNAVFHLVRSSYEALKNENGGVEPATPDYLKTGLAIPLYMDDAGNIRYLNWNLPLTDLSRLQYDLQDLVKKNFIDMLHPMIKLPFELELNENFAFGAPIEKYEGEKAPLLPGWEGSPQVLPKPVDYFVQQLGFVESLRRALGQTVSNVSGEPEDPLKPDQIPLLQSVLPLKNRYYTENSQAYQYRDQLQDHIQRLQDQGVTVLRFTPRKRTLPYDPFKNYFR